MRCCIPRFHPATDVRQELTSLPGANCAYPLGLFFPCLSKDGYAKVSVKYDARGNKTEVVYYGVEGNPCLRKYYVDGKLILEQPGKP